MSCCGQLIEEVNCIYTQCNKTINIPKVIPNSEFTVECSTPELDANLFMQRSIEGCLNCSCEETGYCRCVPVNSIVTITPQLTTSTLEECENSNLTVETYVNNVLIDTSVYTEEQINASSVQAVEITFDQKGKYTIKQTVANCCGNCDKTYSVHVGDSLEVFNVDCHQYELTAHVEHGTLTDNTIEVFNVQNQSKSIFKNQTYVNNRLKFSVPGDGVWIVKFKQEYQEASPYERVFVVYANCYITQCIDNFTNKILKNDCGDCNDSVELELYREELAEFNILKSSYEASINIQYGKRGASILYDKNELESLKNINFLMQKLNEICGQCESLISNDCGCS